MVAKGGQLAEKNIKENIIPNSSAAYILMRFEYAKKMPFRPCPSWLLWAIFSEENRCSNMGTHRREVKASEANPGFSGKRRIAEAIPVIEYVVPIRKTKRGFLLIASMEYNFSKILAHLVLFSIKL